MTKARIQPFRRANIINIGCCDGVRIFPRSVTDRKNALFLHNHFCFFYGNVKMLVLIKFLNN